MSALVNLQAASGHQVLTQCLFIHSLDIYDQYQFQVIVNWLVVYNCVN